MNGGGSPAGTEEPQKGVRHEVLGALSLLVLGIGPRLAFVVLFPTIPVSDFRTLVDFGLRFRDAGWAPPGDFWLQFNPGLPMLLSLLHQVVPHTAPEAARPATAVATGLLPLLPFLLWRGVCSFRLRCLAGLLLALWPGQIFFSGVVAQDNWVLLPLVALASLAVRVLLATNACGYPIVSGLLFAAAVAIRQEMALVLLPFVLVAGVGRCAGRAWRNALVLGLAAGLPLLGLAHQRQMATGRFALTTEHGGLALLGTVVPGASVAGWIDPRPWVASVDPSILESPARLYSGAGRLAWREYGRRPAFHAFRMTARMLWLSMTADEDNLYWSVLRPDVLPERRREAGARFGVGARPWLSAELVVIHGLFAGALALGLRYRNGAILLVAATVVLKIGIHALFSPIARLLIPATALELLTVPLAARELPRASRRERGWGVALVVTIPLVITILGPVAQRELLRRDRDDAPRTYRFPLFLSDVPPPVWCDMDAGRLVVLDWPQATVSMFAADPAPGDRVRAVCTLPPVPAGESILLRLEDRYPRGGRPGRVIARVAIEGREVLRHDMAAEPFAGWLEVPVAEDRDPPGRRVTIEILAQAPEHGWRWGTLTTSRFEFVRPLSWR
jgi:hypothetical protein